jgi:hypothetical protein
VTIGDLAGRAIGVNLLATGTTVLLPTYAPGPGELEALFFPLFAYAVLRSKVGGAVTTTARVRVGSNGTHDDVMPLFVVPAGAQVGAFAMPPLVAQPFVPPNLRAGPISFEIERAAIGPSELTGDILLIGMVVSG